MSSEFEFSLNLEEKKSRKTEILFTVGVMTLVWASVQLLLNFSAYKQIASYKTKKLYASMVSIPDTEAQDITDEEKLDQRKPITTIKPYNTRKKKKKLTKLEKVPRTIAFKEEKLEINDNFKEVFKDMPVFPSDNRIYLPRINKNVPLVHVPSHQNFSKLEEMIQDGLRNGVVVHPVSRDPGLTGNFFATGHSSYYSWDKGRFKDVFALLHEVEEGDRVYVYWSGKQFVYEMKAKKVVPPTQVDVLDHPEDKSILTLMTCTPVGTNKNRLILTGELIQDKNL